nr:MAG TPA: periplasmic solute binding protein [Caudoviricetes sp.]
MKKAVLILAVASLIGCKTENVYLTVFPVKRVTEITDTIYVVPDNRFKREFQRADSIFSVIDKASDDAMKSAIFKTTHLRS